MAVVHIATRECVWMSSGDLTREDATAVAKSVKAALSTAHNELETVPHRGDVFESIMAVIEAAEAGSARRKAVQK